MDLSLCTCLSEPVSLNLSLLSPLPLPQCTKQMISERFGRGSRTVDLELEAQIDVLRDTKRKYESVLRLARALTNHFYSMVQTQHALGDTFADLSQKSPELRVNRPIGTGGTGAGGGTRMVEGGRGG